MPSSSALRLRAEHSMRNATMRDIEYVEQSEDNGSERIESSQNRGNEYRRMNRIGHA